MKRSIVVCVVALVAGIVSAGGAAFAIARQPLPGATARGGGVVEIDIRHSRFSPDRLVVRRGATLRFTLANHDPIPHEFVVGPESVHDRHESGKEKRHPPVPGEVTVDPGERRPTIYTFDEAGTFRFACHLPGHLAYGMEGEVVVVP